MKISELIATLDAVKQLHGDMQVAVATDNIDKQVFSVDIDKTENGEKYAYIYGWGDME